MRLSRLISDLQEITLAESGNLLLTLQRIKPIEILDKIVNNFRGPALSSNIELKADAAEITGEIWVECDRIIQALSNILNNAIRHMPAGGEIKISLTDNQTMVFFSVADTGPGINSDDLPHIFNRFYR